MSLDSTGPWGMISSHTTETRTQGGSNMAPRNKMLFSWLVVGNDGPTVIMHTPAPVRDTLPDHWNFSRFLPEEKECEALKENKLMN